MLNDLLGWHERSYFEERLDHYFLVKIVTSLVIGKLTMFKGNYWFYFPGGHYKALSVKCVSLNDLQGTKVMYKNYPLIKGTLGGYGVLNTPFIYVYWGRVPMKDNTYNFCQVEHNTGKPLGFPCALPDNYFLELDNL